MTPKKTWHNSDTLNQLHRSWIILEKLDTILDLSTNQDPTLYSVSNIWLVNRILPPQYLLSVEPQTPVLLCLAAHIFLPKNWGNAESCPRDSCCGCASRGGFWSSWYSADIPGFLIPLHGHWTVLGIPHGLCQSTVSLGTPKSQRTPLDAWCSLLKLGSSCQKLVVRWSHRNQPI